MTEHDIFAAAIKLTGDPRVAFLSAACGQNAKLREQVDALLQAHDKSGGLLPRQADRKLDGQRLEATLLVASQAAPGTIIAGRYKLLEAIGEGGMGSVWVAEQSQPVKRKVALKLIKAGMDSKSVLARFEAERQALAMMDHPNIAKVLDGGLTEHGLPYFVMEYVKGIPITEYCDSRQLSIPERLQLFAHVCQAVQHAHQKGIIHRDLKPSNIMVAPYDDKPVPKVIDFGLAKAIHQSLTENTLHTAHDMVLGTPLYMSPEQAQLNNIDIDTRSDIYSLGVLLYELLTGSTPLEKQRFKQAAWDEMRRMIREEDPPRPSLRLSSAETLPAVAAGRHTEPARLTKLVRGELDWIVMKALEKDRTRRYETANGFAADVLRYLTGEPVLAAPPSTIYRFQKLVRRNKATVIAASLVLLALLAGMAGTSWQWYRAENSLAAEATQRKKAEDNERAAVAARAEAVAQQTKAQEQEAEAIKQSAVAKAQEAEAKQQAEIVEAVAKFQTDMLAAVDPNQLPKDPVTKEPMKDAVTVVQALEAAVKVLDGGTLKDQPLVEAKVRDTIGNTLRSLARYDDAEPNLQKSLAIRRAALPAGHPNIAHSLNNLAGLLTAQNRLAEAGPLFREALEIWRAAHPAGHRDIAIGLNNLAEFLRSQNMLAEAELLFREAVEIWRSALHAGDLNSAKTFHNLASLLRAQNKLAEAEPHCREALKINRAALPAGHPDIAASLTGLALLLQSQNKLAEAEPLHREALEIWRSALPAGHPNIAVGLNNLADLLRAQNKLAEAEPLFRESLQIRQAALPAGHPDIVAGMNNLAELYWEQGKLDLSVPMFEEVLKTCEAARGRTHVDTLMNVANLGVNYKDAGRVAEAIPLLEEAYMASKREPSIAFVGQQLLNAYAQAAHPAKPESIARVTTLIREMLADKRVALPDDSPELAWQLASFSMTLLKLKAWNESEPLIREALTIREKVEPDDWRTFNTQSMLGGSLLGQKKFAESEPLLLAGYEGLKHRETMIPPQGKVRLPEALERLAQLYTEWHAAEPDKGYEAKAAEWQAKLKDFKAAATAETPPTTDKAK